MKPKFLPFLSQPKEEIVPIGNDDVGVLHLIKRWGISPDENPVELQEGINKQVRLMLLVEKATKRLADEKGISKPEARNKLFAAPVKKADADGDEAVAVEMDEEISLYDYLDQAETVELMGLQGDTDTVAIRAASLLIQHRVVYPVELLEDVPEAVGPTEALVKPLGFEVPREAKFKFIHGFAATTVETAIGSREGSEKIVFKGVKTPLKAGWIGYLIDPETNKVKRGADWTEADTKEYLTNTLIRAVYDFYRVESGGLPDIKELEEAGGDSSGEAETSTSTPLSDSPPENQLTGDESLSDSSISVAETNGLLPGQNLEVSLIG
jgi:hypothetical protein